MKALAKLRKSVRKCEQEGASHVVDVGCKDLCPKRGVAVCKPGEMADRLVVVRAVEDVWRVEWRG